MNSRTVSVSVLVSSLVLAACGGGGGSGGGDTADTSGSASQSATSATAKDSIAGYWTGTVVNNGSSANAYVLILPSGQFFSLGENNSNQCVGLETGQLQVDDASFSGSGTGLQSTFQTIFPFSTPCTYPDGSSSANESVTGTVVPGTSLTVNLTGTTVNGTALGTDTGTLQLSALYNESGKLSRLDGNWQVPDGSTASISNGQIYAQDAATGCSINGTATPADNGVHNLYQVTWTYSGCSGTSAVANGAVAQGAAIIDDQVSPVELVVGATTQVGGVREIVGFTAPAE